MTVLLKDTSFIESNWEERAHAGHFAYCERLPGEDFYVATIYHEIYLGEGLTWQPFPAVASPPVERRTGAASGEEGAEPGPTE